jgi:hypothetical protein
MKSCSSAGYASYASYAGYAGYAGYASFPSFEANLYTQALCIKAEFIKLASENYICLNYRL